MKRFPSPPKKKKEGKNTNKFRIKSNISQTSRLLIDISFKILDIICTGSRLQRVPLLRAPSYNEQIIFSKKMTSDWQ